MSIALTTVLLIIFSGLIVYIFMGKMFKDEDENVRRKAWVGLSVIIAAVALVLIAMWLQFFGITPQ